MLMDPTVAEDYNPKVSQIIDKTIQYCYSYLLQCFCIIKIRPI